jgi:hypothetical protein
LKCHQNWRSVQFVFFFGLWHWEGVSDVRCTLFELFLRLDIVNRSKQLNHHSLNYSRSSECRLSDHDRVFSDARRCGDSRLTLWPTWWSLSSHWWLLFLDLSQKYGIQQTIVRKLIVFSYIMSIKSWRVYICLLFRTLSPKLLRFFCYKQQPWIRILFELLDPKYSV